MNNEIQTLRDEVAGLTDIVKQLMAVVKKQSEMLNKSSNTQKDTTTDLLEVIGSMKSRLDTLESVRQPYRH